MHLPWCQHRTLPSFPTTYTPTTDMPTANIQALILKTKEPEIGPEIPL